jgi:hypothetical protein
VLALVLATLAVAAPAGAPHPHARFVGAVEQAKAHLMICGQLYAAGQGSEAALHASHPVQEIGGRIYGPVKRVDAGLGERVQTALKRPRRDVDAKVPPADLQRTLDATVALLDQAVTRVVPAALTGSPGFKGAVLREMLTGLEKEYDEAYKQGTITQIVEYHDAYAFFARMQTLYRDLAPALRQASTSSAAIVDERMAVLARAFPGLTPPTSPMSLATLREHLAAVSRALDAVPAAS